MQFLFFQLYFLAVTAAFPFISGNGGRSTRAKALFIEERDFITNNVVDVMDATSGTIRAPASTQLHGLLNKVLSVRGYFKLLGAMFLPAGYPKSVPQEYLKFQTFNIIQDFCSQLRGVMTTTAILEGMGVGRSDITPIQATINWVLRDGASMLGGLLFTSLSAANFGQNVKLWRLFADYINNVGITLDMIAPLFRGFFLQIVCIGSVCKALCGIAAGACNVVIAEHWGSQYGNIAEVNSKNGAQHTAVSLIGLFISIPFAKFANATPKSRWIVYSILTLIHMISNYRAMRLLAFRSLNIARFDVVAHSVLRLPVVDKLLSEAAMELHAASPGETGIMGGYRRSSGGVAFEGKGEEIARVEQALFVSPALDIRAVADAEPILSLAAPRILNRGSDAGSTGSTRGGAVQRGRHESRQQQHGPTRKRLCFHLPLRSGVEVPSGGVRVWCSLIELVKYFTALQKAREPRVRFFGNARQLRDKGLLSSTSSSNRGASGGPTEIEKVLEFYKQGKYTIIPLHRLHRRRMRFAVNVCFASDSSPYDHAKGYFEAIVAQWFLQELKVGGIEDNNKNGVSLRILGDSRIKRALELSQQFSNAVFPSLWTELGRRGWDMNRLLLRPNSALAYNTIVAVW